MIFRAVRVVLACGVFAALAVPACGGSSSNGDATATGGMGGAGGSSGKSSLGAAGAAGEAAVAGPVPCGTKLCDGLMLPQLKNFDIPGCCADPATSSCGLDSSVLAEFGQTFTVACQPLAQPGAPDASCPESAAQPVTGTPITLQFPGCCRANGTCGYQLDNIGGLIPLGLGCVDSSPFLNGATPATCGDNAGGEGGMGGAGPTEAGAGGTLAGAGGA
jgi:hypothetical protein